MKGKFVTIEGCEGAGKTKQIELLSNYLREKGIDFLTTREPGGSAIAEKIRSVILDNDSEGMSAECEALLYAAARAQHLNDIIAPALSGGKLVICDRYIDSSFAYQGYARGLGFDFIKAINAYALGSFMPDVTLFLDISSKDAFMRKGGADKSDRLEMSGAEFHEKVYFGYGEVAKKFPNRFVKIQSMGEKWQTHKNIINALKVRGII